MATSNTKVTITANTSAVNIEYHIPSIPNIFGNSNTHTAWNKNIRKKEMIADTNPLFSAVKNAEPKIEKPQNNNPIA